MMIICDASPVVALALCNKLELLEKLFSEVYVPQSVFNETTISGKPFAEKIAAWSKDRVIQGTNQVLINTLSITLGTGESEAISLYWEKNADYLLVDEKRGRKIAEANGIKVIGSVGVLLLAKQHGFLSEIKPMLDILIAGSIRISDALYRAALKIANEEVKHNQE